MQKSEKTIKVRKCYYVIIEQPLTALCIIQTRARKNYFYVSTFLRKNLVHTTKRRNTKT